MAATVTLIPNAQLPENPSYDGGGLREFFCTVTGDANYPAGGYLLDTPAQAVGCFGVVFVNPAGGAIAGANWAVWDTVNRKLKLIVSSTGVEVAGAANVSTSVIPCIIFGN